LCRVQRQKVEKTREFGWISDPGNLLRGAESDTTPARARGKRGFFGEKPELEAIMAKKTAKTGSNGKASAAVKPVKITGAPATRKKSEVFSILATNNGLSKKQVSGVFDTLTQLIGADLKGKAGLFVVPGMMKISCVRKPAVPARKGINPFTGQEQMFKAKPARNVVKVRPLKALKNMV
jgi:nucleoid DNA-binding protein